jgi:hypothetical protein
MITLLGYHNWKRGHVFVAKGNNCWQRAWDEDKQEWGMPPDITICDCCTRNSSDVLRKMKELGLTHKNDGTNPLTEEEWNEVVKQVPVRPGS